jgi:hypothetical protein
MNNGQVTRHESNLPIPESPNKPQQKVDPVLVQNTTARPRLRSTTRAADVGAIAFRLPKALEPVE